MAQKLEEEREQELEQGMGTTVDIRNKTPTRATARPSPAARYNSSNNQPQPVAKTSNHKTAKPITSPGNLGK